MYGQGQVKYPGLSHITSSKTVVPFACHVPVYTDQIKYIYYQAGKISVKEANLLHVYQSG